MRLIDADALKERLKRSSRYFDLKFDIDEAPTIDAVPVVRCKDCKYSKPNGELYGCPFFDEIRADEYCSSGERRAADGEAEKAAL